MSSYDTIYLITSTSVFGIPQLSQFYRLSIKLYPFLFIFQFCFSARIFVLIMPICYGLAHVSRSYWQGYITVTVQFLFPRVGSTFLTISVTVERYMAISRPLADRKNLPNHLITISALLSFFYNIPRSVSILKLCYQEYEY